MKKHFKAIAVTAVIGASLLVGSTLAYFTDADTAQNNFTIGKVAIDLNETKFNEGSDETTNLVPGQVSEKNPTVTNTGINDAFVFIKVTVPTDTIISAMTDGSRYNEGTAAETQLFSYECESGWTLVTNDTVTDAVSKGESISVYNKTEDFGIHTFDNDTKKGTVSYIYAYTGDEADTLSALSAGDVTSELFKSVRFVNVIEDQSLEGTTASIGVTAYAIQTEYLNTGDFDADSGNSTNLNDPASVWKIVSNQSLES